MAPQAGLPAHGCDTAVGVRSANAIQFRALKLLLKAICRDVIPQTVNSVNICFWANRPSVQALKLGKKKHHRYHSRS